MTERAWATLRKYDQTVVGMMADPECSGDLLLVGLWLARATILGDPPRGEWTLKACSAAVFSHKYRRRNEQYDVGVFAVQRVLREDVRRYSVLAEDDNRMTRPCGAPMIRRAGECGKRSTTTGTVVDVETGRRSFVGCCSRHQGWFQAVVRANHAEVKKAGKYLPVPPANTGGVLARHIRGVDWPHLYRQFDEDWTPPPEEKPFQRPKLRLLTFDASAEAES